MQPTEIRDIVAFMDAEKSRRLSVLGQLEQMLSSAAFSHSERMSRFLRYLVEQHLEGKDNELKESLIAVEVFGRKPDYDPKLDAIVRTEALRLRARLNKYYAGEGSQDTLIIELPKGGYIPTFRDRDLSGPPKRLARRTAAAVVTILAIVGISFLSWWVVQQSTAPLRIAVLPLKNLSLDPANDYFSDGLTEEIIRNLSIIEGLEVRSQTSSFALKDRPRNLRAVGKELEVDYVVEGSVLRLGEQLRINAQLVRVRDDLPLWSARFDRELTDIFSIQEEISLGIVNHLRLKLGGGRRRYETNVDAYDVYLRARSLPLISSVELFEQVITMDRTFAPAYAGLASAYAFRSVQFPLDHPSDELTKMEAVVEKALLMDPLLAEAHAARGMVYARTGKWEQAEESFQRAIELDQNNSVARADYAYWLLAVLGRFDESLEQLRIAHRLDPLSRLVTVFLADVLLSAARFDEACKYALTLASDDPFRATIFGRARFAQGRIPEAMQSFAMVRESTNPLLRGFAGGADARAGYRGEAEQQAAASEFANEQALIFAGLGDTDRTFDALDRMSVLGPQRVGLFLHYPELALVQDDPRLMAFRMKVGLPVN